MVSLLETQRQRPVYSARVVERAIDLLFCLSKSDHPAGVTELATQLELNKATVFRLLQTLAGRGLVTRNEGEGTYALAPKVLTLGIRFLPHQLTFVARPYLARLRDLSGETATLSVRIGDERVFIEVLPSPAEVRMVPEVGRAVPLVRGASGKVLLAFAEPEVRARVIQAAIGPQGPRAVTEYGSKLERIRRQGYAWSVEERTPGAASVAAPVRDRARTVVATVSLSAPVGRLDSAAMNRLTPRVVEIAASISRELGCPS